jgi:ATPase
MIPQVVDTVVFIEAGKVDTVYDVQTEVKVPEGLMEEDLARPVIVIRDFETGVPAYEIYTFNRQVVTVPLDGASESTSGIDQLAAEEIEREIRSAAKGPVEVDVQSPNSAIVYVDSEDISHVIGRDGQRIRGIEDQLGIDIDVRTFADQPESAGPSTGGAGGGSPGEIVTPEITTQHIIVPVEEAHAGETVEVQANGEYLFTATVGRGGEIQVSRGSAIAEELERAIDRESMITVQ